MTGKEFIPKSDELAEFQSHITHDGVPDVEQFSASLEQFKEPWHPEIERQLPLLPAGHDLAWEGQDENGDRKKIVMRVTEYMDRHGNTVKAVEYAAGVAAVMFFSSLGVRRYKNGHLGPKTRHPN